MKNLDCHLRPKCNKCLGMEIFQSRKGNKMANFLFVYSCERTQWRKCAWLLSGKYILSGIVTLVCTTVWRCHCQHEHHALSVQTERVHGWLCGCSGVLSVNWHCARGAKPARKGCLPSFWVLASQATSRMKPSDFVFVLSMSWAKERAIRHFSWCVFFSSDHKRCALLSLWHPVLPESPIKIFV